MRRISTATKVVDKFGVGKPGFTNGNAITGVPATDLEDVFYDHLQEELCSIVEAAGAVVDGSSRSQVLTALSVLFAAKAGLATQLFSVATATGPNHAVNLGQFGSSLSANGYQKLPSGLILQWGTYTQTASSSGSSVNSITFPQAFPNQCTFVSGASIDAGAFIGIGSKSTSGAVLNNYNRNQAAAINAVAAYWYAIGY